jgi:rod shape-determining protein MreB
MMRINFRRKSFAIDLGNTNTLVSDHEKLLVAQPSYIVLDESLNSVKAVGDEAFGMFEKTHEKLRPVKPLKSGVIADYDSASKMIFELMCKAYTDKSFFNGYDQIISGVPYATTDVERRALKNALEQFNANSLSLLYEPLAAALGMQLNIQEPNGKMIIDIGGGITEIVIISLSGIASFKSIKVAGDSMDSDIQDYFRRNYNFAIGLKTAERIKINVGSAMEKIDNEPAPMMVTGKDIMKGIPVTRSVAHGEIFRVIDKSLYAIELAIVQTLENCPPELAADIYDNGIYVTGGNALLRGLQKRLERKLKINVHIDPNALLSVSRGIGLVLREPKKFKSVLVNS